MPPFLPRSKIQISRSLNISKYRRTNSSHSSSSVHNLGFPENLKCSLLPPVHKNLEIRKRIARTFTSDTVTVPTPEMIQCATHASLGDDVLGADDVTNALEAHLCKVTGKPAACFMASGTMSNQIAMRSHLQQPPYSVLLDWRAHLHVYEAGGLATISGAQAIPIRPKNKHHLTLEDIEENVIITQDYHYAPTRVIALENTLDGMVFPQEEIEAIYTFARQNQMALHLDGARIWNVAAATGMSLEDLCRPCDTVNMCFTKGLGAPIGSMLLGSQELIAKARHFRKMFGGGMRQTGFATAAIGYALTEHYPLLGKTHRLAKRLEAGLQALGANILLPTETNMVFYDMTSQGLLHEEIETRLSSLPEPIYQSGSRIVVHFQTSPEAVESFLDLIQLLLHERKNYVSNSTNFP